jgi:hypothetical protein
LIHERLTKKISMDTTTIQIEVDSDTALAFSGASASDQRKLRLLLRLRLRELTTGPKKPLNQIMDEIGNYAESQGMTPEVLESLLNDE